MGADKADQRRQAGQRTRDRLVAATLELLAQRDREEQEKQRALRRAEQAEQTMERLRAQLRALGVEPET